MARVIWQSCCKAQAENHNKDDVIALVKFCAKNKDLCRGIELHHDLARRGLSDKCSDALITMYAKCGALGQAKELLDVHKSRDVSAWTALIAGYVHKDRGQDALNCFEKMQHEGLSPNAATLTCVLKACGSQGAADKGETIHDEIVKEGLLGSNVVLGTAIVDMYAKCGALAKARCVLEQLPVRNVISWTALIAGYVDHGEGELALNCFEQMQEEGFLPNEVTYVCLLKGIASIGAADKGVEIHNEIIKQGLLKDNLVLGNALVDMYAKCGDLLRARQVLEELPVRNCISWTALIEGYVQQDEGAQALHCFKKMQKESISPNTVTFIGLLKACSIARTVDIGEKIHKNIADQGLLAKDVVLGSALVYMYAKCGCLRKARLVLEGLPWRNVTAWNALIAGYAQRDEGEQVLNCFEEMQREGQSPDGVTFTSILKVCGTVEAIDKIHCEIAKQGILQKDIILGNSLVGMYAKWGALAKARQVFEELKDRNVASWNAIITGYVEQGKGTLALCCFEQIRCEGVCPDAVTFSCILKACGSLRAAHKGEEIHHEISQQGLLEENLVLGTALIDMYAKCGDLEKAQGVLEGLSTRDVISWNVLISGYVEHKQFEQVLNCLDRMQHEGLSPNEVTFAYILKVCGMMRSTDKGEEIHDEIARSGLLENNTLLGTAVVDMYVKCGALGKACQVLENLHIWDVVAWTALIAGYAEQGEVEQALESCERMNREGLSPGSVTFTCLLKACGNTGAADKGKKIHEEIVKDGLLGKDMVLDTAIVDMYAKCGLLAKAQQVLEELQIRDVIAWNALLAGCSQHCKGAQALQLYEQMQNKGLSPDATTYSSVLSACSRLGLIEDACLLIGRMTRELGVKPDIEHYSCMVDLFARAGHLEKAIGVIEEISSSDTGVWSALLGACSKWGDVDIGRWAFEHAVQIDKNEGAIYSVMAKIYAAAGMQGDAAKIQAMGLENRACKEQVQSW